MTGTTFHFHNSRCAHQGMTFNGCTVEPLLLAAELVSRGLMSDASTGQEWLQSPLYCRCHAGGCAQPTSKACAALPQSCWAGCNGWASTRPTPMISHQRRWGSCWPCNLVTSKNASSAAFIRDVDWLKYSAQHQVCNKLYIRGLRLCISPHLVHRLLTALRTRLLVDSGVCLHANAICCCPVWWCVAQVSRFARLDIDPKNVMWRRVVDINDRCGSLWRP